MDFELGTADLLTVAGASVAATIVAQFFKRLLNLGAAATRTVAMLVGLTVVVIATVQSLDETDVITIILAVLVGMQAGLAASATFDAINDGLSYETIKSPTKTRSG